MWQHLEVAKQGERASVRRRQRADARDGLGILRVRGPSHVRAVQPDDVGARHEEWGQPLVAPARRPKGRDDEGLPGGAGRRGGLEALRAWRRPRKRSKVRGGCGSTLYRRCR